MLTLPCWQPGAHLLTNQGDDHILAISALRSDRLRRRNPRCCEFWLECIVRDSTRERMPKYLKRETLYRQIWTRPIGYLARDFGVNSARLREVCKIMAIPIPAVGHWAAVRAGRTGVAPPLPQHDGPNNVILDGKPRETLVEWIERSQAQTTEPRPRTAPKRRAAAPSKSSEKPVTTPGSPRFVPLKVWATLLLGEYAPHYNTLLRWAHDGRIQPQPRLIGRKWFVQPDAEYIGD